MQTAMTRRAEQGTRRIGALRWAATVLLRRAPARLLGWLPVSVLRGLLGVAAGGLPWLLAGLALGSALLAAVLLIAGCGVARDDAEALLGRGQPSAALRELEAEEPRLAHRDPGARARYALLRGLVHLSLADRVAAGWWLGQAGEIVIAAPSSLDAVDRARLDDALQGLAQEP